MFDGWETLYAVLDMGTLISEFKSAPHDDIFIATNPYKSMPVANEFYIGFILAMQAVQGSEKCWSKLPTTFCVWVGGCQSVH